MASSIAIGDGRRDASIVAKVKQVVNVAVRADQAPVDGAEAAADRASSSQS
jgi:hypothetical protein